MKRERVFLPATDDPKLGSQQSAFNDLKTRRFKPQESRHRRITVKLRIWTNERAKKSQTTNPKCQINFKNQTTNHKQNPRTNNEKSLVWSFGDCKLEFVCYLYIEIWNLPSKISYACRD